MGSTIFHRFKRVTSFQLSIDETIEPEEEIEESTDEKTELVALESEYDDTTEDTTDDKLSLDQTEVLRWYR